MPQRSAFRRRQKQDSTCNAEGGAEEAEEATKGGLQNSPTRDFETMKTNLALLSFSDDIDRQAYSPRQTRKKQTNKQYDAAGISTRATSDNETKSTVDSEDTALAALIARISSVPVTLKRESNKGRCVYADAPITAGTVVMSECAIAAAVSTDKIADYCSYCFRGNSSLRRCTGCQLLHYCNTTCQRADWRMHKYECKALKRLDSNSAIKAISTRIMARLLRQRHQDTSMARLVDRLEGHKAQHTTTVMERYAQLSLAVRELIDASELPSSAAELLELWCRLGCNSHAILDAELEDVGVGIYIGLSLLNHSCSPNCTILFDGTTAVTRSLCAINPGEELTINYLDVTLPKAKRQKELQDRYFFTCRCDKCQRVSVYTLWTGESDEIMPSLLIMLRRLVGCRSY
ncbi:hypothetical protein BDF22DRAFT_687497 [Syncephalis plumigaleata]|nr:hypothetical protein BDF22DRAFT_687497 [Syncephalis plumigaleata]